MDITINLVTIVLSIIAIMAAVWQGFIAKQQLDQAKETKSETGKLLEEIKERVSKIENVATETRRSVNDQVNRLIDKQDENFKTLLNTPKENSQNEMIAKIFPELLKSPDLLKTMMELGKKK